MTYETSFTMRGAAKVTLQHHQILRLPRKMTLQNFQEISRKQLKRHLQPKGSNLALLLPKVISESAFGIKSALIAKVISEVLYRRMRCHHFPINDTICIKIFNYIFFMFVTHTARVSTSENFCLGVVCEVLY